MKTVRSLPNWPPDPGGASPGRRFKVPSSEEARVVRVEPKQKNRLVTFVSIFEGQEHTYDFEAPTEDSASKLRKLIDANMGKSVFEIGALAFDDEA